MSKIRVSVCHMSSKIRSNYELWKHSIICLFESDIINWSSSYTSSLAALLYGGALSVVCNYEMHHASLILVEMWHYLIINWLFSSLWSLVALLQGALSVICDKWHTQSAYTVMWCDDTEPCKAGSGVWHADTDLCDDVYNDNLHCQGSHWYCCTPRSNIFISLFSSFGLLLGNLAFIILHYVTATG